MTSTTTARNSDIRLIPVVGTDDHVTTDGRYYIRRTARTQFTSEGFELTEIGGDADWRPWAADLDGIRAIIGEVNGYAAHPLRVGALLTEVPNSSNYATADGRFVVRIDVGGDGDQRVVNDYRNGDNAITDKVSGLPAAQRLISDIVDREYRDAVIAWTRELAERDDVVAAQVQDMRRSAAIHGRVSGSVGAYWSDTLDQEPNGLELYVYVPRAEYDDAVLAVAELAMAPVEVPAASAVYASSLRSQLASVLEDVAKLLRVDDDVLLANRHGVRDLAEMAMELGLNVGE